MPNSTDPDRPRLLFNSDGGSAALYAFEPPISRDQLCRVIDSLARTQADVYIGCVSEGSFFCHDTKIGEVYGFDTADDEFESQNFRRWSVNVRGLIQSGNDPATVWADRAHAAGMKFWPSMRMNDIHKDWSERWPSLRTRWELERPHVRLGHDAPERYKRRYARPGLPSDGFSWAFDFSVDEVRQLKVDVIEELVGGYDIDGFELDFLSHPMYFKEGRERDGAPCLTEMMREVRAIVQRAGAAKGRELTLLARVLPTEEQCLAIGMDVRTWAAEGLVDVLAPATRGYLNMTPDVSGMVALGHEHGCEVYGGTSDLWVPYYTAYPDKDGKRNPRASVPMFRAAAAKLWHAGVDAIHVFNYDCHCTGIQHHAVEEHIGLDDVPLFNPDEYRILTEIGDREGIARKDKHYVVAHDVDRKSGGADQPLPVDLAEPGQAAEIDLIVADDLDGARSEGALAEVVLRITLDGYRDGSDRLRVELDGEPLACDSNGQQLSCGDVPARQGGNRLRITLEARAGESDEPLRIDGVELIVTYRDGA